MAEHAHTALPETPLPGRSRVETVLRILLTLAVGALVWNCVRMFNLIRVTRDIQPYAAEEYRSETDASWSPRERQRKIRAAFPLPLYPGAKDPEFGQLKINDNPFFRCDYEVAAPSDDVLRFYRRRLGGAGWRDTSEDLFNQTSRVQDAPPSGVLDLQDETFLRYYDHMKRTQATFSRRGAYAMIAVGEGSRPYLTQVGVRYTGSGGPEAIALDWAEALDPQAKGSHDPVIFTQQFGGRESIRTRIVSSTQPAKKTLEQMIRTYVRDGWVLIEMPPEAQPKNGHGACLVRGREMVIVNATRRPETKGSKVMVTTMGSN